MDYHPFTYFSLIYIVLFMSPYLYFYPELMDRGGLGCVFVCVCVCVCVCRRIIERKEKEQLTKKEGRGSNTILI